ncbi:MAG: hypothetical protein AAB927_03520 [Patescibacteria group bacterium]
MVRAFFARAGVRVAIHRVSASFGVLIFHNPLAHCVHFHFLSSTTRQALAHTRNSNFALGRDVNNLISAISQYMGHRQSACGVGRFVHQKGNPLPLNSLSKKEDMKILTANIAYGFKGMDRFASSVWHQLHIHGWGILTYELLPELRGMSPMVLEAKRVAYVKKNQHLEPVFDLIRHTAPDILVLNETLYELYRDEIERELRTMKFQTIAWGVSTHYPGTSISTLLATKELGEVIPCTMPQRPSMGGGAGMAGIRLDARSLSVFGMHLTYRNPPMFKKQLAYIADMAKKEQLRGNMNMLAGDWNEKEAVVCGNPDFARLGLVSADPNEKLTCPMFLPSFLQKSLDHIFIPAHWKIACAEAIAFGSDHLALLAEVSNSTGVCSDAQSEKPI